MRAAPAVAQAVRAQRKISAARSSSAPNRPVGRKTPRLQDNPGGRGNRIPEVRKELWGPVLYQNAFRDLRRRLTQENGDGWQRAFLVGKESGNRGSPSKPVRHPPPQGSRSNFVA